MEQKRNFLVSLSDLSFSEFITIKVIKVIFLIGIVISALVFFLMIIGAFLNSITAGIITLLLSPVLYVIYILILRISLELIIVIFRIAKNTQVIAGK